MAPRPGADVVIPFRGDDPAREELERRLDGLGLREGDTLTVARDERRPLGSYAMRNAGAAHGSNPWIVFLDADVLPPPDLLDRLLGAEIAEDVGVIGAQIVDAPPPARPTRAERHAHASGLMSQDRTLERPAFAYVQTACCAVRRSAFTAVGGFTEGIRSGGDADLCFRLRAAGWTTELRRDVEVVHRSRRTTRAFLVQRLRVGAGAGWLEARYPGFSPRQPLLRSVAGNLRIAARGALLEGLGQAAFELGKRLPNRVRTGSRRATPDPPILKPL